MKGLNQKKGECESSANMIMATLDNKEYYDQEYTISLNNVFKVKEPTSYEEASSDHNWGKAMVVSFGEKWNMEDHLIT